MTEGPGSGFVHSDPDCPERFNDPDSMKIRPGSKPCLFLYIIVLIYIHIRHIQLCIQARLRKAPILNATNSFN